MYYFLRLIHNMKLTETMQSQTNGIRNLILSEYYAQQIPIPSIEKQRDIISQIEVIYNKAIELQKSAKEIAEMISCSTRTIKDKYLDKMLQAEVISMTIPDKPTSRNQKYKLV